MTSLTEFLLARIEEDGAVAKAATEGPWEVGDRSIVAGVIKDGRCAYCHIGEPSWTGLLDINGVQMTAHVHGVEPFDGDTSVCAQRDDGGLVVAPFSSEYVNIKRPDATHIARFDPARVLAECEAKRQIVAMHGDVDHNCGFACRNGNCPTLAALALPHADHSDYREEWAPAP